MATSRFRALLADEWEDTLDSLRAAPIALGGIGLVIGRQFRLVDVPLLGLVAAGWIGLGLGFALGGHNPATIFLALLPTLIWLACGMAGALIFELSGIGPRVLVYWEAYLIILLLAVFGLASLRLALGRGAGEVYRPPPSTAP